ncbi:hypothetical protein EfmE980_2062 [Enterococcus faecium E980]|nr:hypothetical protein EfmE980_2062 [Enterococcus faecium E980]MBL5009610.1 hypothetical protein [Enterococcus lactis]MBL5015622.1 hypothetical protein [Enterococcus lactis]
MEKSKQRTNIRVVLTKKDKVASFLSNSLPYLFLLKTE